MARKISEETIAVIDGFLTGSETGTKTDLEIAEMVGVSQSYVNKRRNKLKSEDKTTTTKAAPKPKSKQKYSLVEFPNQESMDEVELLKVKIASLKQTLKWYEELLEYKAKNK